ncbi:MAG: ADP-ribosylglycohydrolase family protein [Burkholderiales bacterium]|nr:ADP-ribosylglycohydrolase family protein [Phycisphaerae bacterium]
MRRRSGYCAAIAAGIVVVLGADAPADNLVIDRSAYADKLRGMWFGECLANWTGRMTEGSRRGIDLVNKPFYTDASWGTLSDTSPFNTRPIGFNFQSPWLTDDDTDVEYSYVQMMLQNNTPKLSDQQIKAGWASNNTQWLFYSNATARSLMSRGTSAEAAGIPAANPYSHYIDAQLTTEIFGAIAPGRPDKGLEYAARPMLTTSRGHATHAAQYFTTMYSLAAVVPTALTPAAKMRWLNDEARKYIPASSKSADVIDFVVADFTANGDINNWESTRDKIFQRYQAQAGANGFTYREWTESSVNLATGVMALLYGNGDYKRTVQIATLSGWDSDNSTASLGGLFGLVHGYQHIVDQFTTADHIERYGMQAVPLSDNLNTGFTGLSNMPDYVPGTTGVEDTFTLLAQRILSIVDQSVVQAGGTVDSGNNTWTIPKLAAGGELSLSPTQQLMDLSANNVVRRDGGSVEVSTSVTGQSPASLAKLQLIGDGFETDYRGLDYNPGSKDGQWYSTQSPLNNNAVEQWLAIVYSVPITADVVRFIEADTETSAGGYFSTIRLELLIGGLWVAAPAGTSISETLDPARPFQILDFQLPAAMLFNGMRVIGLPGGANVAVSAAELDAFLVPEPTGIAAIILLGGQLLGRRRNGAR